MSPPQSPAPWFVPGPSRMSGRPGQSIPMAQDPLESGENEALALLGFGPSRPQQGARRPSRRMDDLEKAELDALRMLGF